MAYGHWAYLIGTGLFLLGLSMGAGLILALIGGNCDCR